MKVKLNVDQRASLIAGLEAPHSTIILDVPVANLSPATRAKILPLYDVATGTFVPRNKARVPSVLSDAGVTEAVAALNELAEHV